MVTVELRNCLAKELGAHVAVFETLGGATLVAVRHYRRVEEFLPPGRVGRKMSQTKRVQEVFDVHPSLDSDHGM